MKSELNLINLQTYETVLSIPGNDNEITCLCYCQNLDILITGGEVNKYDEKEAENEN